MTSARVLLASGGPTYAHDHAAAAIALTDVLEEAGHIVVGVTRHPHELPNAILRTAPDVIVSHMLWWRMLADRYNDLRATWAYESAPLVRDALLRFVSDGGAFVALHTSTICFDDWPEWGDLLGASWNWERSFHPRLGPVSVRLASAGSTNEAGEIVHGLTDFETIDEVYMHLDVRGDVEPLAFARPSDGPVGDEHPILWGRRVGQGAVAQLGLGHDAVALGHPATAELVRRCVAWTVRSIRASSGH
jgi:uncharacterized protein